MCGICGVIHLDGSTPDAQTVRCMNDSLLHRGPDQGAVMADGPVVLGNRRLAILDLSPAGDLPMRSADSSIILSYNGEVYNYADLRRKLEAQGARFRSTGDTEVILELFRREGAAAVPHLRGMFALAAWNSAERYLLLARDRMGEKPIYYYHDERVFVWASEIKALLRHPAVPVESAFDPHLLALYLGYGYIPAPLTAFRRIHALPPGHMIEVRGRDVNVSPYWTPPPAAGTHPATEAEIKRLAGEVRESLDEAVRLRLISDVPLGAFLSGGIDSSLVVALMRRHSNAAVRTFSIGFAGDDSYDETPYARRVAALLETEHTAFTVQPDALDLLPKLVWHHDQPFADSSAIPTYLVSQLTRQHVTVALTGDGGDELFAGYERFYAASLVNRLAVVPRPAWKLAAGITGMLPEGTGYYDTIKRAGRFLRAASLPPALAYFDWVRLFSADATAALVDGARDDAAGRDFSALFGGQPARLNRILDINMRTYLPDDLLIKADRCSMAASLEGRAPFMDHRLVELAAQIPVNLKLNRRVTKYILKRAAGDLLPDDIIHRPKHGFGVPLGAWLRADIAPVREMLLSSEARSRGLLNTSAVQVLIDEHACGQRDHGQRLWTLLTLEAWHRLFIDQPAAVALT